MGRAEGAELPAAFEAEDVKDFALDHLEGKRLKGADVLNKVGLTGRLDHRQHNGTVVANGGL